MPELEYLLYFCLAAAAVLLASASSLQTSLVCEHISAVTFPHKSHFVVIILWKFIADPHRGCRKQV